MSKILVTAKVNPDLDGTACTLAYADFLKQTGKDAEGFVFGKPQSEVGYFIKKHRISIPRKAISWYGGWEEYVLVDASSKKGMPKCVVGDKVVEIIDHRKGEPEKEFPKAAIQNDLIGAAATIVVERFIEHNLPIKPNHAKLLYGAIFHNTLNFIATNTSERDRKAVDYLQKTFDLDESIARGMFDYATKEIEANVGVALKSDAKEFGTGWKIGAYQLVVWNSPLLRNRELMHAKLVELAGKMGAEWAFLNVINLATAESIIYASDKKGEDILTKALDTTFEGGVTVLPRALLRKQIMPKVNEIVHS